MMYILFPGKWSDLSCLVPDARIIQLRCACAVYPCIESVMALFAVSCIRVSNILANVCRTREIRLLRRVSLWVIAAAVTVVAHKER